MIPIIVGRTIVWLPHSRKYKMHIADNDVFGIIAIVLCGIMLLLVIGLLAYLIWDYIRNR